MSKVLTPEMMVDIPTDIKTEIAFIVAQLERNNELMQRDQQDIERLRDRTRAYLVELEKVFAK